ncbi:MAG: HD domain-containing protein [Alphaproteobacteria bacterium]|nr:HD domain-containing protein [Alphaproteobacteria bacterium]
MMTVDDLFVLLGGAGSRQYGGEAVSQLAHALQAATLAVEAGEPATVVIAALFHDVGHLVGEGDQGQADRGIDERHEEAGAEVLRPLFGDDVAETVRLHVAAKRWLCFAEGGYWDSLSRASKVSLGVQGGPFDAAQAAAFRDLPQADAAIRLRRYDDLAKVRGKGTPGLDEFRAWATRLRADA